MRGTNTLHFNAATMIEAMQEYLDKRMGDYAPQVTDIRSGSDIRGYAPEFVVTVNDKEVGDGETQNP